MAKGDDNTLNGSGGGNYTPQYDASMPDSVTGIDTSYLNGDKSATSSTGPSDNGFVDSGPGATGSGSPDLGNLPTGGSTGSPLSFSPTSPLVTAPTTLGSGGGAPGGDANAFAPTSGVDLAGGFPDPTSSVAGTSPGDNFNDRFQPANAAVANGSFDPQGAAYSGNDGSGVDLTSIPTSATPTVGTGSVGDPTQQVNPALLGNIGPTQFQAGGTPDASATASGGDFGSNLNTAMTQTLANPGPAPAGSPLSTASTTSSKSSGDSSGGGTFLDKLAGGAATQLTKNPLGILAAGGGLALNALQGNKDPEGLAQIRDAAGSLQSTGSVLQSYLTTGTLPPGMQASVDLATKAAKARIIGNYASRGLSTDPTKNSALQQELSGVEQNAIVTAATLGDKLMTQGLSATGMANQLYAQIMGVDQARTKATSAAISNFASALAGGQTSSKIAA